MEQDLRWEQRFSNFGKALHKLSQAVGYIRYNFIDEDDPMDDGGLGFVLGEMIKEGLIQRFKCAHELAWKCHEGLCHLLRQHQCWR